MGLLEDKLTEAAQRAEGKDGDKPGPGSGSGARGSSLGSIVKSKIRTQHQKVEDEDESRK